MAIKYQEDNNMPVNETWRDMANNVNIPKAASGITLEFKGMENNITSKQADVELISLLGPKEYDLKTAKLDNDYWAQHLTPDGLAMTGAIHTTNENQVATSGCGTWSKDIEARIPNLRAPFMQMSEQVNDDQNANGGYPPAFPFITGHGGNSMIVPMGYLGIQMLEDVLTIRPSLPPPLEYLRPPEFYFKGNRIRAQMNSTHTSLTRLPALNVTGVFDVYPSQPMPFVVQHRDATLDAIVPTDYQFSMNETVVVPNGMYWERLSTPGNILQCKPTYSLTNDSQYGGTATDGSGGTRWLPPNATLPALLAVETSENEGTPLQEIRFDWGRRIPTSARVALTNMTMAEVLALERLDDVQGKIIEIPAKELVPNSWETLEVVLYIGNTTQYNLTEPVYAGKFAVLEIKGCQGTECSDGRGGTAVEFELIAAAAAGVQ
jgi:hypothetical protein